jgi:hypothetical protein
MGEPGGLPQDGESYREAFARIESAVDAGRTDLSGLGFWRIVRQVEVEPTLAEQLAEQVGRIDRKAFEARIRLRFPVWFGNLALLVGVLFGAAAVVFGMRADNSTVAGSAFVVGGAAWLFCVHDLAHWVVGRLAGISFLSYFVSPFPPRPGLKIDYASYLRASPAARAWMHASGALATKIAPFVALGFCLAANGPPWAVGALAGIGAFQIATDILFSTKRSDWKRVRRERAVARAQANRRR